MKRFFWMSHLMFTGMGLMFFIGLHFSALFQLRFPEVLIYEGIIVFGLGLVPMWMVTVYIFTWGKLKNRKNWLEESFAEWPRPLLTKRWFKILWFYFCLFFGLSLFLDNIKTNWAQYLSAAGRMGIFIGFYGAGFLIAWANWKKANRTDPSTGSG